MTSEMSPETFNPSPSAAALLLTEIAAAHGQTHSAVGVQRTLESAVGEPTDLARLRPAAEHMGLRLTVVRSDLAGIAADLDSSRPVFLATHDEGQPERWLMIRSASLGKLERAWIDGSSAVQVFEWVTQAALRKELGSAADTPCDWFLADPVNPVADAASGPGEAPLPPLTRLLRFLRPDRYDLLAVVVFAVATGVLLLATPIAVQALVNFVALGGTPPQVIVVALLLFGGLALAGVLTAVQTWVIEILQRRVFVRAVAQLSARLPRVRYDAYDKDYGPELVNRFFDVITIQKVSANLLLGGLGIALNMLVGLTVLAFYHPLLLAFDVLLVIAILLIVLGPIRRGVASAVAESSAKYSVAAWLEELARNPLLFKTGGSHGWAMERTDVLAAKYVTARKRHFRILFGQIVSAIGLQVIASSALLGLGGLLVMKGSLTLGQLVAAELIVTVVVSSVAKMGKYIEGYYDLMAAVTKVGVLLDLPVERTGEEIFPLEPEQRGAALTLTDVSSRAADGGPLISGLNVEIPAGSSLGVTGPTGSGKSTLAQMLWRLRDPAGGTIRLDGRDLRVLDLEFLRNVIAVAAPDQIVKASIEDNVRLSRVNVSGEDVRLALEAVGLTDVVGRLEFETQTILHHDGHPLSHGEIAQLLLARALAGKPKVLIVDGLLNGLTEKTRDLLCEVLFQRNAPWTLVVASNDPVVTARCDRVLDLGEDRSGRGAA